MMAIIVNKIISKSGSSNDYLKIKRNGRFEFILKSSIESFEDNSDENLLAPVKARTISGRIIYLSERELAELFGVKEDAEKK